mgnify:CR=1 FL=1
MGVSTDLADRVSPALAAVVRRALDDPDRSEDATLWVVRMAMTRGLVAEMVRTGELDYRERESVFQEIEQLIAEFGEGVPAVHLLRYRAPGPLSAVISALLERWDDAERPVTLRDVRTAIDRGFLAELVGEGVIDADRDDEVPPQLDALVRSMGEDALAEELLGAEDETP